MSDSGQKFIKRNRPPRVQIAYEDPYDVDQMVELPFVMGVMADLSGNTPKVEKPDMRDRKFLDIDMDNFDSRMKAMKPGVSFRVDNKLGSKDDGEEGGKLGISLDFEKMADLEPTSVARQVPAVAKLLEAREQLANLQRYMDGKVAAEDQLKSLLNDPDLMASLAEKRAEEANSDDADEASEQEE